MATAQAAIKSAKDRLLTARFGLKDMIEHPDRRLTGLMNAVVFGRMVTLSLQNMRNAVDGFDEWYSPVQERLKSDPLMQAFVTLRNTIEKQTEVALSHGLHVIDFSSSDIPQPPPPFATSFSLGSAAHGNANGWNLEYPDGSVGFYPVSIPNDKVRSTISLSNFPEQYRFVDAEILINQYLNVLEKVVEDADYRFGNR